MITACEFIPKVKNPQGQKVNSKLAEDLFINADSRAVGLEIYSRIKTDRFESIYGDIVDRDDNGEPTFASVFIDTPIHEYLNNNIVAAEQATTLTPDMISDFNRSKMGRMFHAHEEDGKVVVEAINDDNARQEATRQSFEELNRELRSILSDFGIEPTLLDEVEAKMGINGVTDFEALKDLTNGLSRLIRIAKGEKGEEALPEEFAHFAIRALGFDHPLVARLLKTLQTEKAQREVLGDEYERYKQLYNNDELLAEECAGKLVAKHLIQGKPINNSYKSIIQRVIDAIKEFFSRFNPHLFEDAIAKSDRLAGNIAKGIMDRVLTKEMSLDKVRETTGKLFNATAQKVSKYQKAIDTLIKVEQKKKDLLEKQMNIDPQKTVSIKNNIIELNNSIQLNTELECLCSTVQDDINILKNTYTMITTKTNDFKKLAKSLRLTKLNLRTVIEEQNIIRNFISEEKQRLLTSPMQDREKIQKNIDSLSIILDETNKLIDEVLPIYKQKRKAVWVEFLKPYMGNNVDLTLSKSYENFLAKVDLEDEIMTDISVYDRWLDSASDSPSEYIRIFDQYIKEEKEKARLKTIEAQKKILAWGLRAEKDGIKDWDFLFERDKDGNKTGRYLSETNKTLFFEDRKKMMLELEAKEYPNTSASVANNLRKQEMKKWIEARTKIITDENGEEVRVIDTSKPEGAKYASEAYQKLTSTQRKYLSEFLALKAEADGMLPNVENNRCIMILKDSLERLKDSHSLADIGSLIKKSVEDSILVRSDDVAFGAGEVADFDGNVVYGVPIFYVQLKKGESMNDISTDAVSTLIAYTAMANNFDALHETVNLLEVAREHITDNIKATSSDVVSKIKDKAFEGDVPYKVGKNTNTVKRIDDLFEMQLYGHLHKKGATKKIRDKEVSYEKIGDTFNKLNALSVYALNFLGGISNITTGIGMMNIEAFAADYFKPTDVAKADAYYAKMLPSFLNNINKRLPDDILHLIDETFNVMQDYGELSRDVQFRRKNSFLRLFSKSPLFIFNNCGEHWMQNRTALAVLSSYKVRRKDTGAEVSLLSELKTEKGKDGIVRLSFGNIIKPNGEPFTDKDISFLTKKIQKINQRMHGIYNEADRNAAQKHALGRMAIMYRKWIVPSWNRRFEIGRYDYDLQDTSEGYWITTARFIKDLRKEVIGGRGAIALYKTLSDTEKKNLRRTLVECIQVAVVALALALSNLDTNEDSPWHKKLLEYQLRRLNMELKAQLPITAPDEIFKILKSPAASLSTMQNLWNLLSLLNVYSWFDEDNIIQTGRFKGWNRNTKKVYMSVPLLNQWDKSYDPALGIPFLKQSGTIW